MIPRLTELAAEIRAHVAGLVEAERAAADLPEGADEHDLARAEAKAFELRMRRDKALFDYFEESEKGRAKKCGHPGDVNIVVCPECRRVNGGPRPTALLAAVRHAG